jgi:hypothetical protein
MENNNASYLKTDDNKIIFNDVSSQFWEKNPCNLKRHLYSLKLKTSTIEIYKKILLSMN